MTGKPNENRSSQAARSSSLQDVVDNVLQQYRLDAFSDINWVGGTFTDAFRGTMQDLDSCIEKAVRETGYIDGRAITEHDDIRAMVCLDEVSLADFANTIVGMTWPITSEPSDPALRALREQGGKYLAELHELQDSRIFDTGIPYGYLNGYVFAIVRERTREILIVFTEGSD